VKNNSSVVFDFSSIQGHSCITKKPSGKRDFDLI